jgi:hypothetical protein
LTSILEHSFCKINLTYIDTVAVFFRYRVPKAKALSESSTRFRFDPLRSNNGFLFGYHLTVHQPSAKVLRILDQLQREYDGTISVVHVARNYNIDKAKELRRAKLRWRRRGPKMHFDNAMYWIKQKGRTARSNRDLLLYWDRPSKITEQPCAHLELRFQRAEACKRAGLFRVRDLLVTDLAALFDRHVDFQQRNKWTERYIRTLKKQLLKRHVKYQAKHKKRVRRKIVVNSAIGGELLCQ